MKRTTYRIKMYFDTDHDDGTTQTFVVWTDHFDSENEAMKAYRLLCLKLGNENVYLNEYTTTRNTKVKTLDDKS